VPHDLKADREVQVVPTAVDRALIYQRFREDYRQFGYAPPEEAGMPERRRPAAHRAAAAMLDPLYRRGLV
jgi:hypothetical protein